MEGEVIMNAQLIYSIAYAAMQHDAVLKIHYNDGTKIVVRPRDKTRTDIRQGCFYIQALNVKNAERKLHKLGML